MQTLNGRAASGKAESKGETALSAAMCCALERPSAPWLVCQRDGDLWGIAGHDDADGPFGMREFAAAVAAAALAAKGTCP